MVALFKQNTITTAAAALVLALAAKWPLLLHLPKADSMLGYDSVFRFTVNPIHRAWMASPWAYAIFSIVAVMAWALYVNYVAIEEKLFARSNYFPALLVVLLSSFPLSAQLITVPFLAQGLVFVALAKTLSLPSTAKPRRKTFDIGFLLSIAVFCYPPCIVFLPFFVFFFRTLRAVRWQEMSAYGMGLLTPVYLYLGWMVVQGKHSALWPAITKAIHWPPKPIGLWPLLAMGALYGALWIYSQMRRQASNWQPSAAAKKKWYVLSLFMVPALAAALLSPQIPGVAWSYVVSPFSIILSVCFLHYKEKYNTFVFYFILAAMLAMVWLF